MHLFNGDLALTAVGMIRTTIAIAVLSALTLAGLHLHSNHSLSTTNVAFEKAHTPIPAQFFGLTVLNFHSLHPSLPFGTTRSWDAGPGLDWADANPAPGKYNFALLDEFIEFNVTHSTESIYTFGRTPRWASSQPNNPTSPYGPGQCAPPSNMSYWDDYVTAIAKHAAGRIKYWELWNEPNESSYCGDIPTMVTMAQHAYRIIKNIDSTALILSPSTDKTSGPDWLAAFLSSGGSTAVDVIAFHGYWSAQAEDIVPVVAQYREVMAANGVSRLPLWDTESSWAYTTDMPLPSASEQAAFIAQSYLLHWSLGVDRFIWYAYDGNSPWGTLYTRSAGETPASIAYKETYRWMVGATLTSSCSKDDDNIWRCPLSRPDGYSAEAVWISNSLARFKVPKQYTQYLDLQGQTHTVTNRTITLGEQPILLQTGPLPQSKY